MPNAMIARRSCAITCSTALLTLSAIAIAEPITDDRAVRLSWVRSNTAESCPDASAVETDVARRLGRSPFADSAPRSIEVLVSTEEGAWRADIQVRARDGSSLGKRQVKSQAESCVSLASAAGLAIALLIDPDSLLREPIEPEAPAEPVQPKPEKPVVAAPPAAAKPSAPASGSFALSAAGALGVMPQAALGVALVGELGPSQRFSAVVGGVFLSEQRITRSGVELGFGLSFAEVGPCYHFVVHEPFDVAGCILLLVGAMHTVAFDAEPVDVGQKAWWASSLQLATKWMVADPLTVDLGLGLVVPLDRHDNVVELGEARERVTVFSQPGIAATGFLGAGVRF